MNNYFCIRQSPQTLTLWVFIKTENKDFKNATFFCYCLNSFDQISRPSVFLESFILSGNTVRIEST